MVGLSGLLFSGGVAGAHGVFLRSSNIALGGGLDGDLGVKFAGGDRTLPDPSPLSCLLIRVLRETSRDRP